MRRALAAVLVAVVAPLLLAVPARAASTPTLRLVAQTSWVPTAGRFDAELALSGASPADQLDLAVTLYPKVGTRSAFVQTLDGKQLGRPLKQVAVPLDTVQVNARGNLVVSLPLPRLDTAPGISTLPSLREGVYPIVFEIRARGGDALTKLVTHLVRLPDSASGSALDVAWIQPLSAPPTRSAPASKPLSDADRTAATALISALTASPSVPVSLDLSPDTVAALGPADVQALKNLIDTRHPVLAAPFVDVDPAALVGAGQADDLASQRETGEDVLQTAIGARGDPRTWSLEHPLTTAALTRLRSLGVTRLALAESALKPLTLQQTLAQPYTVDAGDGDVIQAVSADDGLAAHFVGDGDQVLAAHQLLADLAVLYFDAPGASHGVVVRPPTSWRPNAAFLGAVLPALANGAIVHPVTLDGLFNDVPPLLNRNTPVVRELSTTAHIGSLPANRLSAAHSALDDLRALAGPSAPETENARRRLLSGESDRLSTNERNNVLDAVEGTLDTVRNNVHLPTGRTFRLTARSGTIPLTVVNDNPFPVRVDIILSSEKLEFTDVHGSDRSREVLQDLVLQPGTLTRTVPVKARASAAFSLQVALHVPGGREIGRSRFTIISTAFSGVGILLSIGAALFLLLWWVRHWRTVRRDRRLVEVAAH